MGRGEGGGGQNIINPSYDQSCTDSGTVSSVSTDTHELTSSSFFSRRSFSRHTSSWSLNTSRVTCHVSGVTISASKRSIRRFVITEKAPTRAFSWLKAATTAFTFKTILRHYAKRALTPQSLNVKLGPRRKGHKGRAGWLA